MACRHYLAGRPVLCTNEKSGPNASLCAAYRELASGIGRMLERSADGVNFSHERVHGFFFAHLAHDIAATKQQKDALAAGNSDIGVARLTRAVDGAAHDRNTDRGLNGLKPALDFGGDAHQVNLGPTAGRAGNKLDAMPAQSECLENAVGSMDLLNRVGGQ